MIDGSKRGLMQVKDVRSFLDSVLDEDIHTKRIASLANATLGVMTGASLGVAVIGKSLAQAPGLLPKHAVKQVDRLLLLNAFAVVLLTLLGAAGESLGMDRHLKSNTVKTRTHSLFRQGCMLYDLMPNMPEHRLKPLIQRYAEILQQSRVVTETFAIV